MLAICEQISGKTQLKTVQYTLIEQSTDHTYVQTHRWHYITLIQ